METIFTKLLRPVRMTAKMLVFEHNGREFLASKRVANEILSGNIKEAYIVEHPLFTKEEGSTKRTMCMLATPSCW